MKKRFIIYTLGLPVLFFMSYSLKAQEQKKPSERSFAAEINKVKRIQATRDQKISQMQQLTENTAVPPNNKSTPNAAQNQANNANSLPEKKAIGTAIKPSAGSMRPAKKPVASRG